MNGGRLEVITGPMYGGKSTELIIRVKRYEISGLKAQLFKPAIDARYTLDHVASHDGLTKKVIPIQDFADLKQRYNPEIKVLGIDEPQFLESSIVDLCDEHAQQG